MKRPQSHPLKTYLQKNRIFLFLATITCTLLVGIFYINFRRAGSFAFVDEYYSFVAAKFLMNGKTLYSEIFSHHQPLPIFMSFIIQKIMHPLSIYQLVLFHREFVVVYSLAFYFLLIARFKYLGIFFSLLSSPLLFYFFGHLFLGEVFVMLPLVYLAFTCWSKYQNKTIYRIDYIISAFCFWLIIWMREPLIPTAILLFGLVLWNLKDRGWKILSIGIVAVLSLGVLAFLPFKQYMGSLIGVNFGGYVQDEISHNGLAGLSGLKIISYPFLLPFWGNHNYTHLLLSGLSIAFTFFFVLFAIRRNWKQAGVILLILGLSNLRYVNPDTRYFSAFHILPWLGLWIAVITMLGSYDVKKWQKKIVCIPIGILVITFALMFLPNHSYLFEPTNKAADFTLNYSTLTSRGDVIKTLSQPQDTLYIESSEILPYWNSSITSAAPYSIYLPIMDSFPKYMNIRKDMFANNPPIFYHGVCFLEDKNYRNPLPKNIQNQYEELMLNREHSCLFVLKSRMKTISDAQWKEIERLGYTKETIPTQ